MKRALLMLLCGTVPVAASPEQAQGLIERARFDDALEMTRLDLLRNPGNTVAKYNYAVAAYAAGIYGAAADKLKELTGSADAAMALRSYFQLGNTSFRAAERMEVENPLGAAQRFEESVKYFAYAAAQPGETRAMAAANETLSHERAAGSFLSVARRRAAEGDRAARVNTEDGFAGWEESLGFFEQALVHVPGNTAILQEKNTVLQRVAREAFSVAGRYQQQARLQERYVLQRALDLYRHAITYYEKSGKFGHPSGATSLAETRQSLGAALLRFSAQQRALAERELKRSAAASLEALAQAASSLGEAETLEVDPAAIATARAELAELWHRAHDARGDEQGADADNHARQNIRGDEIQSLTGALSSYTQALRYRADAPAVAAKREAVRLRLSDRYEEEGRELLALARQQPETKLEEALAAAEKSVQSFRRSLDYNADNAKAQQGLAEAEQFLEELRKRMKQDERMAARKSKDDMKERKDLKDLPKDLALKLLDYRNNNPAAKTPQMLSAPENQSWQDW